MVAFKKSSRFFRTFTVVPEDPSSTELVALLLAVVSKSTGGEISRCFPLPVVGARVTQQLVLVMVGAVMTEETFVLVEVVIVEAIAIDGGAVSLVGVGDLLSRGGTGGAGVDASGVDI